MNTATDNPPRPTAATSRTAMALMAISILGIAVCLWLKFAYDIKHVGPIPTVVLAVVPFVAASWYAVWPNRSRRSWAMPVMVAATALAITGLLLLV